ncbi:hypothetical protein M9H77_00391 [Catharanthus roseus]|nr:hypothetical protein M9H77_00391 [Catharanthus roseus]
MEEVLAHVHPDPIVPDVLTRQYKHRSGLMWSRDREMCITDLQCRCFGRNLFQSYSTAPCRLVDIIDRTGHMLPDFSNSLVHVRYLSFLENIESISTYSWGSCVLDFLYRNFLYGCPIMTMTSILQEVDDMAIGVIQGPPSSPTHR